MINSRKITSTVAALLVALSLTSCGTIRGERAGSSVIDSPTVSFPTAEAASVFDGEIIKVDTPEESLEAFNFQAAELFSGAIVSGSDIYLSGPIIMTFVSPGCLVTAEQGPALAEAAELNSEITYVFVHTGGEVAAYKKFVDETSLYQENVVHINDKDQALWNRFNAKITPSSILVNTNGAVRFATGGLDPEGLRDAADLVRTSP